jgi:hypothetical protein
VSLKNRSAAWGRRADVLSAPETVRDLLMKLAKARAGESGAQSPKRETWTDLAKAYLRVFPETTVFRLEVKTGEFLRNAHGLHDP